MSLLDSHKNFIIIPSYKLFIKLSPSSGNWICILYNMISSGTARFQLVLLNLILSCAPQKLCRCREHLRHCWHRSLLSIPFLPYFHQLALMRVRACVLESRAASFRLFFFGKASFWLGQAIGGCFFYLSSVWAEQLVHSPHRTKQPTFYIRPQ